ncbi:MAG: amidohydrolase family protein, partial [Anaerovorax sp.]
VKSNKIVGLGKIGQEDEYITPKTKVVLLNKNQMVMPGIHDNHIHLIQAGMLEKYADLYGSVSQEEAADRVVKFAEKNPHENWMVGFGWARMSWTDHSLPKAKTLDLLFPDRPVLLLDSELHGAWANGKAFELCGIDKHTHDPQFGMIARDEEGNPEGYLYETALSLVAKHAFEFEEDTLEGLINLYTRRANQYGITSTSDMTPYLGINLAYEKIYYKMSREEKLTVRIHAARDLFEDIHVYLSVKEEAEKNDKGFYRVCYTKQFLDGVITNYTALMLESYWDKQGDCGGALLDIGKLNEGVERAHKNGISVRLHACGDGAVRVALDAFENAIKKYGQTKARHQIEHIEVIAQEDLKRFQKLGVIASVQPEHIVSGIDTFDNNCYPEVLGPDRERYTWAFRSLLQAGAVLACGSDAPVVEGNPFMGMYCGLTRLHPDGTPKGGWNPEEKLSIEELLQGYTFGAAYAEGREEELGTLEIGKLADIAVLDRNLLTATPDEVRDTRVLLTMVDGKIVYDDLVEAL